MSKIEETLERIETLLLSQKEVFNIADFCNYTGLSKSAAYKLTSQKKIPHSVPNGKVIFFEKKNVDSYLLSNPAALMEDIHQESINYIANKSSRGGSSW